MKLKVIPFLILCLLFQVSCKDENISLYEELDDDTLLTEVLMGGEIYYQYTYNDAGLVVEEKSKFSYTKHKYNSRNQLVRSDSYLDERIFSSSYHVLEEAMGREEWVNPDNTDLYSYTEFNYKQSGELSRRDMKRINTDYQSYSEYSYNGEGKIERRTAYNDDGVLLYDQFYYDEKGNLVRKERWHILENGSEELQTTYDYEFDSQLNPYRSFRGLMIPGRYTNTNNIVKERYELYFDVPGFDERISITTFKYEYNEYGYPIRVNDDTEYRY